MTLRGRAGYNLAAAAAEAEAQRGGAQLRTVKVAVAALRPAGVTPAATERRAEPIRTEPGGSR